MKVLVTGAAGFIGFHLSKRLLERNDEVVGLDNINSYYDVSLKYARLGELGIERNSLEPRLLTESKKFAHFRFIQLDLTDQREIFRLYDRQGFDAVCHLAAQAGVRYSLKNPYAYIESNIVGFFNILEGCRKSGTKNLSYASTSSVYGLNERMPFSTEDNVDHPISLYAASKKSNELMAHTYSYLYNISTTGLRFFTVYGPWGRPDMALFLFTKAILESKPIQVYNRGNMERDFTYIDDIIEGVVRVIDRPAQPDRDWRGDHPLPSSSQAPYRVYNIGNGSPVKLLDFIEAIEQELGIKAERNYLPMQPGDIRVTFADTTALEREFGYRPSTGIEEGIKRFMRWYRDYYEV